MKLSPKCSNKPRYMKKISKKRKPSHTTAQEQAKHKHNDTRERLTTNTHKVVSWGLSPQDLQPSAPRLGLERFERVRKS